MSVIATLDSVQGLLKGNRIRHLLLRFEFIHLAWIIDAYKAVPAAERVQGKMSRHIWQLDASVTNSATTS
jgi:hypothetical protein